MSNIKESLLNNVKESLLNNMYKHLDNAMSKPPVCPECRGREVVRTPQMGGGDKPCPTCQKEGNNG